MLHVHPTRCAAHRPPPALPMAVIALLLLALCLSACRAAAPADASKHTVRLQQWYPDPGAQALAVAAEQGNAAEVRRLMKDEGVNPDKHFAPDGTPLLGWPIFTHNPAGLKAMLENGADPNAKTLHPAQNTERFKGRYENNALVFAAKQEDPIYLKLLLDHGGDPNTRNSNGESLLFQSMIWKNQMQNVMLLVERGADVNDPHAGLAGPILYHYAIGGSFKMSYWLMERGADPTLQYHGGLASPPFSKTQNSSVVQAIFWMPVKDQALEWQMKCQRFLLKRGIKRPPMSDVYRRKRQEFGFPTDEKDISLPEMKETSP
jgi:uncharacterized protein